MKLIKDTLLIFKASMKDAFRTPVWMAIGLFQPLCFLFLFAPLLENISKTPGFPPGSTLTVFLPGLLVLLGLYGTSFVGFGLIADLRAGILERLRVTPISRYALLLGRALRDVTILLVQSSMLILIALPMGLKINLSGAILSVLLISLIGLTMSCASYTAALALKSEDALAPLLNFFMLPIQLLSGITLPLTLAPLWMQNLSAINPLSHAVNATRALFYGNLNDVSILIAFGVMLILAIFTVFFASRSFGKALN